MTITGTMATMDGYRALCRDAARHGGTGWLIERACEAAGITIDRETPAEVEVVRRIGDGQAWTFVLNHSDAAVAVELDRAEIDVLSGAPVTDSVDVPPNGVAIIRSAAAG